MGKKCLRKVTATEVYDVLVHKEKLVGKSGKIKFKLKEVEVTVKTRDVVGNIIQDWLGEWFKSKKIEFGIRPNTQDFPDFFLDAGNQTKDLLEVKSFDLDRGANFDIANFEAYCRSLKKHSYRLDADYLIFGYSMDKHGNVKVKNIWHKKIWEISGPSGAYPVKVQQKQKMIYNLRPIKWYGTGKSRFNPFKNKEKFVRALYDTLLKYSKTKANSPGWLEEVRKDYLKHTGNELLPSLKTT